MSKFKYMCFKAPKTCGDCLYFNADKKMCYLSVNYLDESCFENWEDEVSDDCPMRDLPSELSQYMFVQEQIASGLYNDSRCVPAFSKDYEEGWNDCLHELTKMYCPECGCEMYSKDKNGNYICGALGCPTYRKARKELNEN